jgi:ectoine hydroxylase-related dioxygenase (phytanoyl-CoA dioxygenase family)
MLRQKADLENTLKELEDALDVYSRPGVAVFSNDFEAFREEVLGKGEFVEEEEEEEEGLYGKEDGF